MSCALAATDDRLITVTAAHTASPRLRARERGCIMPLPYAPRRMPVCEPFHIHLVSRDTPDSDRPAAWSRVALPSSNCCSYGRHAPEEWFGLERDPGASRLVQEWE